MPRTVVSRLLHRPQGEGDELCNEENDHDCELNLMMIRCEENEPYRPAHNTKTMFLELLVASYKCCRKDIDDTASNSKQPRGCVEEDCSGQSHQA